MLSEKNPVEHRSFPLVPMLKILFSVALLCWVLYKVEWWNMLDTLKKVKLYYLVPALLFFVVSKVISSIRLNHFFRSIELRLSEMENLKLYWIGMLYNTILPGGVGGDGYKTWYLQKHYSNISWKRIAKAIVLDRVVGLLVLMILLAGLTMVLFPHFILHLMAFILTSGLLYVIVVHRYFPRFANNIQTTMILSILVQVFQLVSVIFILFALGGQSSYLPYFFLFLLSSVATIIPFTVGGAGMREMVFLYCSAWFSIDMYIGISMVFIFYLLSVVGALPGLFQLVNSSVLNSEPHKI